MADLSSINPAHLPALAVSLGAICGLFAAKFWIDVARSVSPDGFGAKRPDPDGIRFAATFTALSLGLASIGWLWGRITGGF